MARSVLKTRKPSAGSKAYAMRAFAAVWDAGADWETAVRFATYMLERNRQAGGGGYRYNDPGVFRDKMLRRWEESKSRGFLFARGKNATNYFNGGIRLLVDLPPVVGLDEDTPAQVAADKIREEGRSLYDVLVDRPIEIDTLDG